MANKYLRWKDPACNGQNIEWEEMTGKDFFDFLNSDQSRGRYFIRLGNDICPEADIIFIEAEKSKYEEWYKESRHHRYLTRVGKKAAKLSMDCPYDDEGNSLHDLIADLEADVESAAMSRVMSELLHHAITQLSPKRREVITAKYFDYPDLSDKEIAKVLSMNHDAFRDLRFRGLNDLKKILKKASSNF